MIHRDPARAPRARGVLELDTRTARELPRIEVAGAHAGCERTAASTFHAACSSSRNAS
jgi:hypothetical protein